MMSSEKFREKEKEKQDQNVLVEESDDGIEKNNHSWERYWRKFSRNCII